jgi:demethylmenaquinone methyltransferase/2-methoxy-6-polyprenyl-1,4-benzoquinol methylase
MSNASAASPLAPHPEIREFYGCAREKHAFLREIFNQTAPDYDRIEHLMALGSGRWYRRRALRRAGVTQGSKLLDVATGTGLVAREALDLVGPGGLVIGVDPSIGMIGQARSLSGLIPLLGIGEALPLADQQFDFVSMGYALRHLPDLRAAFNEFYRVLKPGGRLCVLEITRPAGKVQTRILAGYFQLLLPIFARLLEASSQTHRLWKYYWDTIDQCVPPGVVMQAITDAGFKHVRRDVSLGVFSEYTAQRLV